LLAVAQLLTNYVQEVVESERFLDKPVGAGVAGSGFVGGTARQDQNPHRPERRGAPQIGRETVAVAIRETHIDYRETGLVLEREGFAFRRRVGHQEMDSQAPQRSLKGSVHVLVIVDD